MTFSCYVPRRRHPTSLKLRRDLRGYAGHRRTAGHNEWRGHVFISDFYFFKNSLTIRSGKPSLIGNDTKAIITCNYSTCGWNARQSAQFPMGGEGGKPSWRKSKISVSDPSCMRGCRPKDASCPPPPRLRRGTTLKL